MDYKKVTEDLVKWVGDYAKKVGAKGFVFGLSGGIDSAVIAAIAKRVFPDNSLGLIMPCDSIEKDREDALKVAKAINLE
ncbi:MAG: NAD(+) synthetase, partial [Peptoniphilus grossensis]